VARPEDSSYDSSFQTISMLNSLNDLFFTIVLRFSTVLSVLLDIITITEIHKEKKKTRKLRKKDKSLMRVH
jgi:hypothetical protein